MANIKNLVLKKKIEGIIYDLYVKTSIDQVVYDDTTNLADKLSVMLTDIEDSKTKLAELLGEGEATSIASQISKAVQDAVDAINNEEDPESVAGKIKAVKEAVDAINNVDTGILATAKAYTDAQIGFGETETGKTVKQYVDDVKSELDGKISGAFHFKGTVDYVKDLPTENVAEGDVYIVKYRGEEGTSELNAEYAFNGTEFTELGSIMDLSAYSTTEQVTSLIATAKSEAIEAAATDATTKANTVKTALDEYKASNDAVVATKARFLVGTEVPEDLTEADVFGMIITDPVNES